MKIDVRYSKWIKAVLRKSFNRCPHCGQKPTGGIHHIFPRGCKKTKYVVENGIPTCYEFHRMWENPVTKKKLVRIYIGKEKYNLLRKLSNGIISIEESGFTEIE